MQYYISKTVDKTFDEAIDEVTKALSNEGFGILTEIDVKETLKKKLDVDFRKYRILGACNARYALKALEAEDKIGVMLPCSVIVQETSDGRIEIAAMDPIAAMGVVENQALSKVAHDVKDRLSAALENV